MTYFWHFSNCNHQQISPHPPLNRLTKRKFSYRCIEMFFSVSFFWHRFYNLYYLGIRRLKGTGTRDYNWLKVVWSDGSWLGESPTNITKIFNCPFNFTLNEEILCRLAQKAFEFAKSFLKPARWALAGIQTRRVGSGRLSKLASWFWPAFKSSRQIQEICYPIGAKDLNSHGFEKLFTISKAFRTKRLKNN
jgi:hypothetical protein